MLREFYEFIAKKINSYFQMAASEGTLLKGESFCLKLDDENMVLRVSGALKELLVQNNTLGKYKYQCGDGSIYETYTLRVIDDEVIIAAQVDGMTNDFLCATLRNAANEEQKPLLMISSNLIDSAISGSRDMAACGMPFYGEQLMKEIRNMVDSSTQLTGTEKCILNFELYRRESDVFSDKASLYEYKDLLAIMSSGKIEKENFPGFRLFTIDGKSEYLNYGQSKLEREINNNNKLFERIDRGFRFGNLENDLSKDFDDAFITRIEKLQKQDPENWSRLITYKELIAAMEKKQIKTDNPLNIENEDIMVYGDLPVNTILYERSFFIRNEGSQTSKKRTKTLMIFNESKYTNLHIRIKCNVRISNVDIMQDDAEYVKEGKDIVFKLSREGLSFHKLEIKDSSNDITYVFKTCIIDISADYIISTIRHSFSIEYKKPKKNSRIKLAGITTDLTFNSKGKENASFKLGDNEVYLCKYDERLHLYATEEELSNYGSGIKIEINFTGIVVPFVLYPDETKSVEITGRKILRDKLYTKRSFEFFENEHIFSNSQEFFAKAQLLRELKTEQKFIDDQILYAKSKHFYDSDTVKLDKLSIDIDNDLRVSYIEYLGALKKDKTIPTLAYLSDDILRAASKYVSEFEKCFKNLKEGGNLSVKQENALLLGTIEVGAMADEILLTPFHPLNVKYQIDLLKEKDFNNASDIVIERLNSVNLLPYIQRYKKIYKVSEQLFSMEWKYYALAENRKYRGGRRFVPKLVEEKISEFISHFRYIFDDINNRKLIINLINMGDCSDVFVGIAQYFIHTINRNPDVEKLVRFEIHIYTDDQIGNAFTCIKEYSYLKEYLTNMKLEIANGTSMNSLEGIFSKNIECYFCKDTGKEYAYSHISFYEMESGITSEQATMAQIETGVSLGGLISGVPSSKYGHKYRTGFGTKYAKKTSLLEFAELINALIQVGATGNPYHSGVSISTQIDVSAEEKMDYIYEASNWVVFVEPKVDLDFFSEKEATSDLLIIHYSDQYTSSSGYDAITVTRKSKQYSLVIQEFLKRKGITADLEEVHKIINLFNAINGDWLLRLVSSKKITKDTTFSREKISIVAAIKFMLAFLKHPNITWVPISLEEMLRVSSGAGLSKDDGFLSAKNLGFEKGPTSDDLLFIGLEYSSEKVKVYLYPTEVKTGINDNSVIKKAFEQASATADGFRQAFDSKEGLNSTILYKVNRNFLMQLLVTSCKKMKVYHVDDSIDWNVILDKFREELLNEEYILSYDMQEILGKGAVLSFRKGIMSRRTSFKENAINFIEMPEIDEFGLILKNVEEIYEDIKNRRDSELMIVGEYSLEGLTGDISNLNVSKLETVEKTNDDVSDEYSSIERSIDDEFTSITTNIYSESSMNAQKECGINVLFGTNEQDGSPIIWYPNDTSKLFHTNTGIIGTMGTGKTQFTKSIIAQLYKEQKNNIDAQKLGILIFDYKGDYNESKEDFISTTNAKVLKPYHLPFNPLAITKSKVFKPLLPIHIANSFKDTLSKVYGLGPKQQDTLFQCIINTYGMCGIDASNSLSWDNEPPTFEQVFQRYANDEEIKKNDSLSVVMNKLHQFQIFEGIACNTKSLFEVLNGVVVIDLSGYDPDIQNLIVAIILDLFYTQMQAAGSSKMEGKYRQLTKLILVDEADNFMSEGFPALKKILKEGREFGVGTILSTQFLKHFSNGDDDFAKYILTWVVHNVSDLKSNDVDYVFKTEPKGKESKRIFNDIKSLKIHHSIIKMGTNKPIYAKDKAFWELCKEWN